MARFVPLLAVAGLFSLCMSAELAHSAQAQTHTDYCRYGAQSALVLIDRTTPYDGTDRSVLLESVGGVVDGLTAGERIEVVTIGAHYSQSETVFTGCLPGCPPSQGILGDVTANCSDIMALSDRRRFRQLLLLRLGPVMDNSKNEPFSDITGTIAETTQHPPGGRLFASVFVFSDMLENSQALPWRQFRDMAPDHAMVLARQYQLLPAVRGAHVHIAGYGRLNDVNRTIMNADLDQRVRTFWQSYFAAGGARSVSFQHSFVD